MRKEMIFSLIDMVKLIEILVWGFSIGLGIVTLLYIGKHIINIVLWIKGGIENGDGKLENRELQIFIFTLLCLFIVISIALWDIAYPDVVIVASFAGAGILYGVNEFRKVKEKEINKKN